MRLLNEKPITPTDILVSTLLTGVFFGGQMKLEYLESQVDALDVLHKHAVTRA